MMSKANGLWSVLLGVALCMPAFGAITIDGDKITFPNDSTQSVAATGGGGGAEELTNVTTVQADGTATENGTALRDAMDAITNDGEGGVADVTKVIQLAAGTYDMGSSAPLTLKPNTLIRGVGRIASIITGTHSVIIDNVSTGDLEGHDMVLRDLQVRVTTTGTGISLTNAAYLECFRIAVVMEVSGGVTATGVKVNGAEIDMTSSYLTGDPDNSGGSVTLLDVTNGDAYLINSGIDSIEVSTDGALNGIVTHTGAEVDIVGGDYLVEREKEDTLLTNLSSVTLLNIGANSRVNMKNAEAKAWVFGSDGGENGTTLTNSGGFTAFSTWFDGIFPDPATEFFTNDTNHLAYYQCFGGGVGEM